MSCSPFWKGLKQTKCTLSLSKFLFLHASCSLPLPLVFLVLKNIFQQRLCPFAEGKLLEGDCCDKSSLIHSAHIAGPAFTLLGTSLRPLWAQCSWVFLSFLLSIHCYMDSLGAEGSHKSSNTIPSSLLCKEQNSWSNFGSKFMTCSWVWCCILR